MKAFICSRRSNDPFLVPHPSPPIIVQEMLLIDDVFEVLFDFIKVYVLVLLDHITEFLPVFDHVELVKHECANLISQLGLLSDE